ncbi:MAG: cellulose synthase subunit BcsC-related outer membrane protein [Thioalkalivibrionaceae bacterium]
MAVRESVFVAHPLVLGLIAVLSTPATGQTITLEDRLRAEIEQMRADESRLEMQLELARELNASRQRLDSMRREIMQNLGGESAPMHTAPFGQVASSGVPLNAPSPYAPTRTPYQNVAPYAPPQYGGYPAVSPEAPTLIQPQVANPQQAPQQMAPLFPQAVTQPPSRPQWQPAAGSPMGAVPDPTEMRAIDRVPQPVTADQERVALERRIREIEAELSSQLGGALGVRTRTGTEGLSTLNEVVATASGSTPIGDLGEVWVEATQVNLDTQSRPSEENAQLVGSAPLFPATVPPTVTSADGTGLRIGFERPDFGASVGVTPQGFLSENVIGNVFWRPFSGPFQLEFDRSPMRDTLLSYAGTRDFFTRKIFGGVVSNTARLSSTFGDPDQTEFYGSAAYSTFEGENVASNTGYSLNAGATWPVSNRWNENIRLGLDFLAMGHDKNLSQFTLGHGGYFSPRHFFRPSVTFGWDREIGDTTAWNLTGRLGYQTFRVNAAPFFPNDPELQAESGEFHDGESISGMAYAVRGNLAHRLTPHWITGGWFGIDNSRDYENIVFGLYARYYFSRQDRRNPRPDVRGQNPQ